MGFTSLDDISNPNIYGRIRHNIALDAANNFTLFIIPL